MMKVNWRECEPYFVHGEALERSLIGLEHSESAGPIPPQLQVSKKILFFNFALLHPGKKLENHVGEQEEIYYIIQGNGIFYWGGETKTVKDGDAIYVPNGEEHGLKNTAESVLEYIVLGTVSN